MLKRIISTFVCFLLLTVTLTPIHAESNKSYGWGYKKSQNNQPPETGFYGSLLEENGGYYLDHSGEKVVYLTFDNGYEEGYTGKILDVLKDKQVPATFFVTGHYVKSAPDLVKRMVKEGHIVGNHSWSHPDFTKVSEDKLKQELDKVHKAVADLTGVKTMSFLRPPRGVFSARTLALTNKLGYTNVFWSLAFVDWNTNAQKGWEYAYRSVIKQIHPGAVILLHTVSSDNAEALDHLIDELRKRGYTFKSLNDLVWKNVLPKGFMY